jgi:putative FmdB family regulatory protein
MPIFDYLCLDCGKTSEILVSGSQAAVECSDCGSGNLKKLLSAHSSLSGPSGHSMPGPGDTACCGSSPGHGGCAGPGSCCGRNV